MPKKRSKNNQADKHNLQKRLHPGKSNASTNPFRTAPGKDQKKGSYFRQRSDIKLLNMKRAKPNM